MNIAVGGTRYSHLCHCKCSAGDLLRVTALQAKKIASNGEFESCSADKKVTAMDLRDSAFTKSGKHLSLAGAEYRSMVRAACERSDTQIFTFIWLVAKIVSFCTLGCTPFIVKSPCS